MGFQRCQEQMQLRLAKSEAADNKLTQTQKYQQNCCIKAAFMDTQSRGGWMVRPERRVLCCTDAGRAGSQASALHSKKGGAQPPLWREYTFLCPNLSPRAPPSPRGIAERVTNTLPRSMIAFCGPLSSCSTGFVGNVTHH